MYDSGKKVRSISCGSRGSAKSSRSEKIQMKRGDEKSRKKKNYLVSLGRITRGARGEEVSGPNMKRLVRKKKEKKRSC